MQAEQAGGDDAITAINITPLVDVALVLVIIFMVTMPFLMEKNMKVKSSDQKATEVSSVNDPVLVEVSASQILVEGRQVKAEELSASLAALFKERGVSAVAVSAQPDVLHGRVVQVLDNVMGSGATEMNILEPKEKS